jgi:hypothetical protein
LHLARGGRNRAHLHETRHALRRGLFGARRGEA